MLMCGKVLQLQGQVNHSGKTQRLGVKQVKTWATSTWLKDIIEICIKVPSFLERYYLLNCYIPDQLKRQVLTVLVDDYITMNTDSCEPRICKPTLHGKVLPGPHEHTHKLFWGNWVCFFCKYCDKEEWSECSFSVCVVCVFFSFCVSKSAFQCLYNFLAQLHTMVRCVRWHCPLFCICHPRPWGFFCHPVLPWPLTFNPARLAMTACVALFSDHVVVHSTHPFTNNSGKLSFSVWLCT